MNDNLVITVHGPHVSPRSERRHFYDSPRSGGHHRFCYVVQISRTTNVHIPEFDHLIEGVVLSWTSAPCLPLYSRASHRPKATLQLLIRTLLWATFEGLPMHPGNPRHLTPAWQPDRHTPRGALVEVILNVSDVDIGRPNRMTRLGSLFRHISPY
jgi:hypothetical protein